jgi:hypothetical protein
MEKLIYTVNEFCAAYGVSRSKLYLLWQEGEGPTYIKVGSRTLIAKTDANKWASNLPRIKPKDIYDQNADGTPSASVDSRQAESESETSIHMNKAMPKNKNGIKKCPHSFNVEFTSGIPARKSR